MILPGFSHDENIQPRIPRIVKRCLPCYFNGVRQSVLIRKPEYLLSSLLFNRVTKIAEKEIISTAVADITKEARRARGTMSISNAYRKHLIAPLPGGYDETRLDKNVDDTWHEPFELI